MRLDGDVVVRVRDGVAHYSGLRSCGDVWACPVCSAKIRNKRALEIADGAGRWVTAGHGLYLAVFTAPHEAGMPLGLLWKAMTKALQAVRSGKAYQKLKKDLGIAVTCTGKEVTEGGHGWHPHQNVLFFTTETASGDGLFALLTYLRRAWCREIEKAGLGTPDLLHGVRVDIAWSGAEAGLYVAKVQEGKSVGNELARGDLKSGHGGHRTPFQILEDLEKYGLLSDVKLWQEYEQVMHGKRALVWSRGYREILGLDAEQTDEEIAAEEVGGRSAAVLGEDTWHEVVTAKRVTVPWSERPLPAYTAVLEAAEHDGLPGVNRVLAAIGAPEAIPPMSRGPDEPP